MFSAPLLNQELIRDALAGLSARPRTLPSKWFYDERGSALFDAICELPEYYPTRTELSILQAHGAAIAARLGSGIHLIEFGAGSSLKTRVLLRQLHAPRTYVPLDISREHLLHHAAQLEGEFPGLAVCPVVVDYTGPFDLPPLGEGERVLFFPGSTIGNFTTSESVAFLRRAAHLGETLLIGIDLVKSPDVLLPAYNDAAGVTAQFNLNLLARLNYDADADFDLTGWRHEAIWNEELARIEMYLVACRAQMVCCAGQEFHFEAGESICTEYSHKYTPGSFAFLAYRAGWQMEASWSDQKSWFGLQLLRTKKRHLWHEIAG